MGFRQGAYAKVWRVEDKGNYSVAQVSISRKKDEVYETEFQNNFVRLVGTAHDMSKNIQEVQGGTTIKITSCDVTSRYDKEKNKEYTNFVIFGFEYPENNNSKPNSGGNKPATKPNDGFMNVPDGADEELPFN